MRKIKPIWISIFTLVVFAGALAIGMTTDWWQTTGRRTPISAEGGHGQGGAGREVDVFGTEHGAFNGSDVEEEGRGKTTSITGGSTLSDALYLGISTEELEKVLEGPVDDFDVSIKTTAQERGLKFSEVKDTLNALIN